MAKAVALMGLLCGALGATACSPFGGVKAFTCTTNEDCSGGVCEADSLCSFIDAACESGRRYGDLAGGQSNKCVGGSTPDDAPIDQPVIPPEAGDVCFGVGGLVEPCFSPGLVPVTAIALTGPIDTTNDLRCSTDVKGTADCVIAGPSITLAAGTTVNVTGSRALILLATNGSITIEGVLNGASNRVGATTGPKFNDSTCGAGTAPGVSAGGAGGSFGALGGNGGNGVTANPGGIPGAVAGAVTTLRGGCRGQDGTANGAAGIGGNGGGALYLIATTSIVLQGAASQINASGASATGGAIPAGGAGGAGSGGLIGLFAPALTNQGTIFAKGGGGGEGSGSAGGGNGQPGQDAGPVGAAAGGTGGSGTGGDGGAGGTTVAGTPGGNSTNGGGGGGGGAGVIKVLGGATASGTIVPGPS